ncbi:MAG: 4-(cytidine 5'-diphospho)-2-C-methyl-D-erythritol kinase [Clostridiales bacterium]|jgi:4-diphosphocytidyl-2-C-methyl-D-erythritol kinase|nr:4-(cytidine 5'-diphospho)-2-C-methyl-D-erythritol kinase [Eubacteriales bacterium]MDH7567090.1 4-(cytidine 5'-diphospho)-2-C-methyl-D-erythritol kinase [Clostridiales bacterium]
MNAIELNAHAKINLSIDVIKKRPDGYHEVRMIMQTVRLHDKVVIEKIDKNIEVECCCGQIPPGSGNIAYKAAKRMLDGYRIAGGVRIKIWKSIPVAAGLAGGSADAAAVIKGLDRLFSLGLKEDALMALAKEIGADVPFCIKGGTMLAEGIGEVLTGLHPLPETHIILVKPKISIPTKWVYGNLNLDKITRRPDMDMLINAIKENKIGIVAKGMVNVLETVTAQKYDVIGKIKEKLLELGAEGSMMSGSGPTVFGIFTDAGAAQRAYDRIKGGPWDCYLTQTVN